MRTSVRALLTGLAVLVVASAGAGTASAKASLKRQLVGTWEFVSVDIVGKDGNHVRPYGPHPSGVTIFERNGHFAVVLTRPDRPKYASNDRLMGTAEEYKATAEGVLAYSGTYTVNEAEHSYTMHVDSSSFPNWIGSVQTRTITSLTSKELKFTNSSPSTGVSATVTLTRVK